MSPFIFWSCTDESPPLSGERGACTALRDPRLAGTEPCRLPGAGQDAVGLTHPLLGRAFSVISPQHAAFPPCLVPKEPLCRCALLPTPPHVGPYTPCTPFGCHLCARCDPGPLGFALLPASLSAGDAQQLPVPLPSPRVLQKFVCPGVLQGCVPAGCSAPLAIPLSGPMSPCSPSQRGIPFLYLPSLHPQLSVPSFPSWTHALISLQPSPQPTPSLLPAFFGSFPLLPALLHARMRKVRAQDLPPFHLEHIPSGEGRQGTGPVRTRAGLRQHM